MKNFNLILLSAIMLVFALSVSAQSDKNEKTGKKKFDKEAFFAKRNAFIKEKVGLTKEEAVAFFPLDNELIRKKYEAGADCRKLEKELRTKNDKTDEDYNKLLNCRMEEHSMQDVLDNEYLEKFRKILTAEKILKYRKADKAFFDSMMRDKFRSEKSNTK